MPKVRMIGGRYYTYCSGNLTKGAAQRLAQQFRRRGFLARVIKSSRRTRYYEVWTEWKRKRKR